MQFENTVNTTLIKPQNGGGDMQIRHLESIEQSRISLIVPKGVLSNHGSETLEAHLCVLFKDFLLKLGILIDQNSSSRHLERIWTCCLLIISICVPFNSWCMLPDYRKNFGIGRTALIFSCLPNFARLPRDTIMPCIFEVVSLNTRENKDHW